jgi:hypothetical protein
MSIERPPLPQGWKPPFKTDLYAEGSYNLDCVSDAKFDCVAKVYDECAADAIAYALNVVYGPEATP